jgi:hypothetical protein
MEGGGGGGARKRRRPSEGGGVARWMRHSLDARCDIFVFVVVGLFLQVLFSGNFCPNLSFRSFSVTRLFRSVPRAFVVVVVA